MRNLPLILAAFVLLVAIAGVAALRSRDQNALCQEIEALKAVVRPDPFDLAATRQLLSDLNVDPASERAQRLIEQAQSSNARERRELAPSDC